MEWIHLFVRDQVCVCFNLESEPHKQIFWPKLLVIVKACVYLSVCCVLEFGDCDWLEMWNGQPETVIRLCFQLWQPWSTCHYLRSVQSSIRNQDIAESRATSNFEIIWRKTEKMRCNPVVIVWLGLFKVQYFKVFTNERPTTTKMFGIWQNF